MIKISQMPLHVSRRSADPVSAFGKENGKWMEGKERGEKWERGVERMEERYGREEKNFCPFILFPVCAPVTKTPSRLFPFTLVKRRATVFTVVA